MDKEKTVVGVFLFDRMDHNPILQGNQSACLVLAISRLKKLEKTLNLSGPKFKAVMENDCERKELQLAVKGLVNQIRSVSVLPVELQ